MGRRSLNEHDELFGQQANRGQPDGMDIGFLSLTALCWLFERYVRCLHNLWMMKL
jgi:hypothetical protein